MADRYWVGNGGNWSDNTNHWAASSGGAPGASKPTSSDAVFFDANSFSSGSQTVTVDETANCLNMDWTGAANTPTLAGTGPLNLYGSLTFIANMAITTTGYIAIRGTSTVDFAGQTLTTVPTFYAIGSTTLASDLNIGTGSLRHHAGTFSTSGFTVTCGSFVIAEVDAKTLTLGASVINCTSFSYSGSNLTLSANTSTINVTGTGAFAGGNITTYNNINLNGTAHTVSGSFICVTLALPSGTTQTITFTAGICVTCTTATLSGDATHAHTVKSGTAGTLASIWATNKADDYVTYTDMLRNYNGVIVADCTGAGGGTFAGGDGTFTSLTVQGAGNYALTITGNNTFATFTVDRSQAAKTIIATGTTQTVRMFSCPKSGTTLLTLTNGTWVKSGGGYVNLVYLSISGSTASPSNCWYAGTMSTDGGGNSGWIFRSRVPYARTPQSRLRSFSRELKLRKQR